ncbi:hypothetical protein JTB14_002041 [Gonioctena quinquepunctata]|nr:hypothetical protein JTB14_002041 [Gonioctena quinquepunctata]
MCESKELQEEIIFLRQEGKNIRDSNINLVKLLDHSKDHTRMEQCTNDWKNTSNQNYNLRNRGMYSQSNTKPIITEDEGIQQKDIDDLRTLLDDSKSEIVSPKNAKPTASSDYRQPEDALLSELYDRLRRSNNVLLFIVPESNDDMKSVTDIPNKLSSEPIPIRSPISFGKRNKLGFRTPKATLPSNPDVRTVLTGRSVLKGGNITISKDLTHKQREHETKIKDELKSRNSDGENVILNYLNATPHIVPKNCPHPVSPTPTSPSIIRTQGTDNYRICAFSDNIESLVNHLQPTQISHVISRQLSSSAPPTERAPANESISLEIISNTICLYNLFQINNILNSTNSLLDLVLIQKNNMVNSPDSPTNDVLVQNPYHPPLSLKLPVSDPAINSEICPSGYYHDFKSANLMLIRELLDQVSWDELFKNKPLDHMINILFEIHPSP